MNKINLVVCVDNNLGIGKSNTLPWHVPEDMKLFKSKTIGNGNNCVIMGKNTFYSIPKKYFPLNNRHNVILSSSLKHATLFNYLRENFDTHGYYTNPHEQVSLCRNMDNLLHFIKTSNYDTYWIIGGEALYKTFLQHYSNHIYEIHMTILPEKYNCDTFFPSINDYSQYFKVCEGESQNFDKFDVLVYKNEQHELNRNCDHT
jgi:dihydrofolate reductase